MVRVQVEIVRLTTAVAELRLVAEDAPPGAELRGRLMGPRCGSASTIEVAYPLRPQPDGSARVVIPEPNLWEPERPYVYWGPVEVWHGGTLIAEERVEVGLRAKPSPTS